MKKATQETRKIEISTPAREIVTFPIVGTAPLVSNRFSAEVASIMIDNMANGTTARKRAKGEGRPARDFEKEARASLYRSTEGWFGMPCNAFKAALVRAGSLCGVEMTLMKQVVFVVADGVDELEGHQLVRIYGEPETFIAPTRTKGVANAAARGRFAPGWRADLRIEFESQFIGSASVANLVMRAGSNVGIGAGRPLSTSSVGMGWGTFSHDLGVAQAAAE